MVTGGPHFENFRFMHYSDTEHQLDGSLKTVNYHLGSIFTALSKFYTWLRCWHRKLSHLYCKLNTTGIFSLHHYPHSTENTSLLRCFIFCPRQWMFLTWLTLQQVFHHIYCAPGDRHHCNRWSFHLSSRTKLLLYLEEKNSYQWHVGTVFIWPLTTFNT